MNGVTYKLCRVCHPEVDHKDRPSRHHFHAHHAAKAGIPPEPPPDDISSPA
jgi:hypothetical protein